VNIIWDINGNQFQNTEYDPWGKVSRSDGNVDPNHRLRGMDRDNSRRNVSVGQRQSLARSGKQKRLVLVYDSDQRKL